MPGLITPSLARQIFAAKHAADQFAAKPGWAVSGPLHDRLKRAARYLRRRIIRRMRAARAAE